MGDYKPEKGERVRGRFVPMQSAIEGVVSSYSLELDAYVILIGAGVCLTAGRLSPGHWEWERLPDPEPDWTPGDVAQSPREGIVLRVEDGEWVDATGRGFADFAVARPLTPLVLNGKPVTDGA